MDEALNIPTSSGNQSNEPNQNIDSLAAQQAPANISNSEDANMPAWKGDPRYFQSGQKAGQLKPSAQISGIDREKSDGEPFDASGLLAGDVKHTEGATMPKRARVASKQNAADQKAQSLKAQQKAEAAAMAATVNAALVMKVLDGTGLAISNGEFAPDEQMRAATQEAWKGYLMEKGYELPGWVQVSILSAMYLSPAIASKPAKATLSGFWAKAKAWYIAKRG